MTVPTEGTSLLPIVVDNDSNKDGRGFEPLDQESARLLREKNRRGKLTAILAFTAAVVLLWVGKETSLRHTNNNEAQLLVVNDVSSRLFADMLTMAAPPPSFGPEQQDAVKTGWADCVNVGKTIAEECYELNPVDLKACKARGKEAAKSCYKAKAKEYKDYYKNMRKEYKEFYKGKKKVVKGVEEAEEEQEDGSLFDEILAMAPPNEAEAPSAPFWVTCKQTGKTVAEQCLDLNPVDPKGCKDRGKEAAKVCYKQGGKAFGKQFKDLYKPPAAAKGDSASAVDVDALLEDVLAMAPPDDSAPLPFWVECKQKGKEIAASCLDLNPVDPEGCKDRGKEAAKVCYKQGGKAFGKQFKDLYKPPAVKASSSSSSAEDATAFDVDDLFGDILAMAPPDDAGPLPFWKACKLRGKQIAEDCLSLNPIDPEGCADRGKEAAKVCYKTEGKAYGKAKKSQFKTPPDDVADVDELFGDILAMAPPDDAATPSTPFWKECKERGKEIAQDCLNLNPVDPEGCADRGKEAAKVCYKTEGKAYGKEKKAYYKAYGKKMKDTYKSMGKEFKDLYKPTTSPSDDADLLGSSGPDVDWSECHGIEDREGKAAAKECYLKIVEAYRNYYKNHGN